MGRLSSVVALLACSGCVCHASGQPATVHPANGQTARVAVSVQVGGSPAGIAVSGGSVWVATFGRGSNGALIRLNARTHRVRARVSLSGSPLAVTVADSAVWVTNSVLGRGSVWRIDTTTEHLVGSPIRVGRHPEGIAAGFGSVWVANEKSSSVSRIDAHNGVVIATIHTGGAPVGIATGGGGVWATDGHSGRVFRINPRSDTVRAITVDDDPNTALNGIAVARHQIWAYSYGLLADYSISTTTARVTSSQHLVGGSVPWLGIAAGDGSVWTAGGCECPLSFLVRIDERTRRPTQTLHLPAGATGIAIQRGHVWVTDRFAHAVTEITVGH